MLLRGPICRAVPSRFGVSAGAYVEEQSCGGSSPRPSFRGAPVSIFGRHLRRRPESLAAAPWMLTSACSPRMTREMIATEPISFTIEYGAERPANTNKRVRAVTSMIRAIPTGEPFGASCMSLLV